MSFDIFYSLNDQKWEDMGGNQKRRIIHMDNITTMFFQAPKGLITSEDHSHVNEQVSYLIKGKLKIIIGDKKRIINENEGYMVPPNIKHHIEVLEDSLIIDFFSPKRVDLKTT